MVGRKALQDLPTSAEAVDFDSGNIPSLLRFMDKYNVQRFNLRFNLSFGWAVDVTDGGGHRSGMQASGPN